nr:hypothetical protein [Nanoarchaeum sp.]
MVKNNKKGYMKTFEALIALLIFLGVVIYSLSLRQVEQPSVPEDIRIVQRSLMEKIENDVSMKNDFFVCNQSKLNNIVDNMESMYSGLEFDVYPVECIEDLNIDVVVSTKQNVYTNSLIIFNSAGDSRTVTIKIWRREV